MKLSKKSIRGFTIVELLIVIVIIAVLASIVTVAYAGITARAQSSKVNADITTLEKAIIVAREAINGTLMTVTGNNCTRCACPYLNGDLTKWNTLAKTNNCWVQYYSAIDKISAASGANLSSLKAGDPWGSPYSIDENELESGACNYDNLRSVGSSANINGGTTIDSVNVPFYSQQCSP